MERQVKELVEFFTIKSVRDGELQGRVSGDLAWRLLRGETRPQQDEYKVSKTPRGRVCCCCPPPPLPPQFLVSFCGLKNHKPMTTFCFPSPSLS